MLNQKFHKFLFSKGVLVNSEVSDNAFYARFTLANKFNISITGGQQYVHEKMISFVADMLGEHVPDPFYRNFPNSVRELSSDLLVFDQLVHYSITYGFGNFSEAGYSLFEEEFERIAFKEKTDIKKCIVVTEFKNVSICPCNMDLLGAELLIDKEDNKEYILKNALKEVKKEYDFILIDCPPSLNYITLNAFCATDSVLIPIQCEYYALEGVSDLTTNIKIIKQSVNPDIEIEGILLTMFDTRTNLSILVADDVKSCFPDKVFKTAIPRNTRLGEAPSFGQPIIYYDKWCKGAESYTLLAKEVIKKNK